MISVLPFELAAQQFAVPLEQVIRVVPMLLPTQLPGAPSTIAGVVSMHGQLLPVIDLAKVFGLPELRVNLWTPMLWLRTTARELLVPVASLHELSVVEPEKFVEGSHPNINSTLLSGVLTQVNGLVLIMDLEALLSPADEAQLQNALTDYMAQITADGENSS